MYTRKVCTYTRKVGMYTRKVCTYTRKVGMYTRKVGMYTRKVGMYTRKVVCLTRKVGFILKTVSQSRAVYPLQHTSWLSAVVFANVWGRFYETVSAKIYE
jgi:hypothetical protein